MHVCFASWLRSIFRLENVPASDVYFRAPTTAQAQMRFFCSNEKSPAPKLTRSSRPPTIAEGTGESALPAQAARGLPAMTKWTQELTERLEEVVPAKNRR